jgi:hypothetical protein
VCVWTSQRHLVLVTAHMAATLTRDGRGVPQPCAAAAAAGGQQRVVTLRVPFDRAPDDTLTTLHALHMELHVADDDAQAAERLEATRFFAAADACDPAGEARALLRAIVQVDQCNSESEEQGEEAVSVGVAVLERTLRAARDRKAPAARALTLPDAALEHDLRTVERCYVAALVGSAGLASTAKRAARRLHEQTAAAELSGEEVWVEAPLHRVWAHALGIRQWLVSWRQTLSADGALGDTQREAAWRAAVRAAVEKAELAVECSLRATPEKRAEEGRTEDEGEQLQRCAEQLNRLVKGDVSAAELIAQARRQELSAKRRLVGMEALRTLLAMHRAMPDQQRDVLHWVAVALRRDGDGMAVALATAEASVAVWDVGGFATHYSDGLETADVHATLEVRPFPSNTFYCTARAILILMRRVPHI